MPKFSLCLVYRMAPLTWCLSRLHGRDVVAFFEARPPGIEALQSNMSVQVFVIVSIAEGLKTVYTGGLTGCRAVFHDFASNSHYLLESLADLVYQA
jgi:hypothetical protein